MHAALLPRASLTLGAHHAVMSDCALSVKLAPGRLERRLMSPDRPPAAPSRPVAFIAYDPGFPVTDYSRLWLRDHAPDPDTIDPGTLEIVALTPVTGARLTISLAGDDLTRLIDAARRAAQSGPALECLECPRVCECGGPIAGLHDSGCPAW